MSHRFDQDVARIEHNVQQDSNIAAVTLMTRDSVDVLRKLASPVSSNGSHLADIALVDGDKIVVGSSGSGVEQLRQPTDPKDLPQATNPKSDSCPADQNGPEPSAIDKLKPLLEIPQIPLNEPLPIDIKPLIGEDPCFRGGHYKPTPLFERPFTEPFPALDEPIFEPFYKPFNKPSERPWHRHEPFFEDPYGQPFHPFEKPSPFTRPTIETPQLPDHITIIASPPGGFKANQPDGSMQVVDEEGVKTFWPNGSVNVKNFDGTGYAYNPPKDGHGKPEYKHWGPKSEDNYSENVLILKAEDLENAIKY